MSRPQGLQQHDIHHGGPHRVLRLRLRIVTALVLVFALAVPALAQASGSALIIDCGDGTIDGSYSQRDYADALANLPADVDEYSDCRDQIHRLQLGGRSHPGGGSGSTGGGGTAGGGTTGAGGGATGGGDGTPTGANADPLATATPEERASFEKAVASGSAPVQLDGRPVTPGTLGGAKTNGLADLPTSLLAILALLAVGGLGAAGLGTRRLVHGRRST